MGEDEGTAAGALLCVLQLSIIVDIIRWQPPACPVAAGGRVPAAGGALLAVLLQVAAHALAAADGGEPRGWRGGGGGRTGARAAEGTEHSK